MRQDKTTAQHLPEPLMHAHTLKQGHGPGVCLSGPQVLAMTKSQNEGEEYSL